MTLKRNGTINVILFFQFLKRISPGEDMITGFHLFNLLKSTDIEEYKSVVISTIGRITDYYIQNKVFYCGRFIPGKTDRFNMCEMFQWDSPATDEAIGIMDAQSTKPSDITQIENKLNTFRDKSETLSIRMESLVPSPNSNEAVDLSTGIMRLSTYSLAKGKTEKEFMEFDKRVTAQYSLHLKPIDWLYQGTFRTRRGGLDLYGELDYIKAPSPEAALAKDKELGETQEISDIINECSTFPDPDSKFGFWLEPFVISEYAKKGIKFI